MSPSVPVRPRSSAASSVRVAAQPGPRRLVVVGEPVVVADAEVAAAEQLVLDAEQLRPSTTKWRRRARPIGLRPVAR